MTNEEYLQEANKWLDHIKMLTDKHAGDEFFRKRFAVLEWLIGQVEKDSALNEGRKEFVMVKTAKE